MRTITPNAKGLEKPEIAARALKAIAEDARKHATCDVVLLLNGGLGLYLYLRERVASYFLWSGVLLLESSLWIALLMILAQQL